MSARCMAWILAATLSSSAAGSDLGTDRESLSALHARERQAHLKGDAELLATEMADQVIEVENGKVTVRTREGMRQRFAHYFSQVKYSFWDDVAKPRINISPDRQMAWVVIHVRAGLTDVSGPHAGQPREFQSSWISVYEKQGAKWRMVGISSGVVDTK
jgi:ketosteroid isomerase-like protein